MFKIDTYEPSLICIGVLPAPLETVLSAVRSQLGFIKNKPFISALEKIDWQEFFKCDGQFYDADGATHMTAYATDGFDRLRATTFADATAETLTYDNDNNIVTRVNRSGQTLGYGYDALDRKQPCSRQCRAFCRDDYKSSGGNPVQCFG